MRKQWMIVVAAMTAIGITACGNGDGIVINGTTAAEAESGQTDESSAAADETTSGTTIEIITGETTAVTETAAESTEGQTEAATTAAQTQASTTQASTTQAATTAARTQAATQPETTAAKTYTVKDMKKTMYATASVRVRSSYSTGSEVLAGLAQGEKIEIIPGGQRHVLKLSQYHVRS